MNAPPVVVGKPLTVADLVAVTRRTRPVVLDDEARAAVERCRRAVEGLCALGDAAPRMYGINTGFGALADTRIEPAAIRQLQRNLVRSHASGVGAELDAASVRGMLLLRAQTLALAYSGVRAELVELLLAMLARDVLPCVPAQGSVGASGDLAPLAHLALTALGEGRARLDGELLPSAEALARAGLAPIELEAKEGLALVNGTQYMTARGALSLHEARGLARAADIAGAMSLEALKGSERPFELRLMQLRPHQGQLGVSENLRRLLGGSEIMESHRDCGRVQDAYSLRCMPQVHGASRDAFDYAESVLVCEMNSVTDNPSVFVDEAGTADVVSGGNFHGQPVAYALDLAAIAVAELGNISERRVEQLVNPALSSGLPPFLARSSGLNSGFMIAQVASASLVSENKVLCHPASVDSIPSSAGKEDHVSMGSIGAHKLAQVVANARRSIAIELLTAAAGLDLRLPLRPGLGVRAAYELIRRSVPPFDEDRPLYAEIEAVAELIRSEALEAAVTAEVGALV